MGTPVQDLLQFVRDATIHPLSGSGGGGVPTSRTLFATAPFVTVNGGPSATLAADVTIAAVTTGGGSFLVGSGRLMTSTAPIKVRGGLSAALTADVAITIDDFAGTTSGAVPGTSGNDVNKSLRGNGTWVTGTAGGVTSIVAGTGISLSPVSGLGDVTVNVRETGLANPGYVPAIGSVDATLFLCKTNPPSWQIPGVSGFVTLQGSTPGGSQSGHVHISGTFIADSRVLVGANTSSLEDSAPLFVRQTVANVGVYIGSFAASSPEPSILFRASRGTPGSPTGTGDGDILASLKSAATNSGAGFQRHPFLEVIGKGAANANRAPFITKLEAWGGVFPSTSHFLYVDGDALVGGVGTTAAKSGWEIASSYGRSVKTVTYADTVGSIYTINELTDGSAILADATANTFSIALPSAVGRKGRIYRITRVDSASPRLVSLIPNGGQQISGRPSYVLFYAGHSVELVSDNANWWITNVNDGGERYTNLADGTPLANTVVETTIFAGQLYGVQFPGCVFGIRGLLKYSTTGTPTLRIRVRDAVTHVIADSTAITLPNNSANYAAQLDCIWAVRAYAAGFITISPIKAVFGNSDGNHLMTMHDMANTFSTSGSSEGQLLVSAEWGTANASNTLTWVEGDNWVSFGSQIF